MIEDLKEKEIKCPICDDCWFTIIEQKEQYAKEQQLKLLNEIHKLCTSPYTVPIEFKIEQRIRELKKELEMKQK